MLLKPEYDILLKNVPLHSKRKRLVAEIDILAFKDGAFDVYEVKCSHRLAKAKRQLHKIRKLMNINNSYFFCGESKKIINV